MKNNKEKLIQFVNDEAMSNAVYKTLIDTFLSDKIVQEVNVLAASRLAVKFLNEAWRELANYKINNDQTRSNVNVGM